MSTSRLLTLAGLVAGAVGIAILWGSGITFPVYPPPGIILLLAGTLFVGLVPWRWAPAAGALLGLFVIVGFLLSSAGIPMSSATSGRVWQSARGSRLPASSPPSSPARSLP